MEIVAYLAKIFGPTLARTLLAALFKDRIDFEAIGYDELAESLADSLDIGGLVTAVIKDDPYDVDERRAIRNATYLFDKIGDEAAEKLVEIFQREGDALPEAEWMEAVDRAKATLNQHGMRLLIAEQLDAYNFGKALQKIAPDPPLETEAQGVLYNRLLGTAAQVVFAIADTLPHFTRDSTARLLQNEARLLEDMGAVLANQQQILANTYGRQMAEDERQFESQYRTLIRNKLNRLELFGVDHFDGTQQPLDVAFIKLSVKMAREVDELDPAHLIGDDVLHYRNRTPQRRLRFNTPLPVEEALSQGNRLLIVSEAGSGKTTLLKWIAVQAAGPGFAAPLDIWSGYIPFFVRLRDYANVPLPPFGNLANELPYLANLASSVPKNWPETLLQQKQALILLDGFDEVSDQKRQEAARWLDDLFLLHPESLVVVSSRPSGIEEQTLAQTLREHAFQQITLLPMTDGLVTQFIQRWHEAMLHDYCKYADKARVPAREEALSTALENRRELRDLAKSPILSAMLCALNLFELGTLPQDRIRLYDHCINILLRRDENRTVDSTDYRAKLRPDSARRLLARIAYWMMKKDPAKIQRDDAERLISAEGLNATDVLDFLAHRSVIFRSQTVSEFDFIHRTFVEYLAGQEIVRAHEVGTVGRIHGTDSEWHETIRLLAGHVEPSDQVALIQALYGLSQSEPKQRSELIFLAWDFWNLLDARTKDAKIALVQHLRSLTHQRGNALDLSSTQVSDLSALAPLTNLQSLDLSRTQVSDLSGLAPLTNLQHLNLRSSKVSDLSGLAPLTNLQHLYLSSTQVSDLSGLAPLTNLQHLYLMNTLVSDLSALASLTNLQLLDLMNTQVSDLSTLAPLTNLQRLYLMNTQVSDVSMLQEALPNLKIYS